MTIDYGTTIHLPKTDFPRRAGLAQKEPQILARWQKMGLYEMQRAASKGREKFILHFGPPFANGSIHIGHFLSHSLKDIVCRSYQLLGYDAPLVPGFDCHGLPIEWKIEEEYRAKGKNAGKDTDRVAFLKECRAFAAKWIDVQTAELQRTGILADWKNPYRTMDKKSEATIVAEMFKFLKNGALYRGSKPVMWSVPEQTALAEAEVEYKDHTSDTVWVKFPVKKGPKELEGASVVIWTTTPWTLPGNRAVAYGEGLNYICIKVEGVANFFSGKLTEEEMTEIQNKRSRDLLNNKLLILEDLYDAFSRDTGLTGSVIWKGTGKDFEGVILKHPLNGKGYDFDVPMLAGDFVTTDAGTGFVHIAPGHGEDDYRLGLKYNIEVPHTVAGDGKYFDHVPLFAGVPVYMPDGKKGPGNKFVTNAILENGNLVAKAQIQHSYPHSWRSKAPVIFRNTPQWFISMDKNGLREKALAGIQQTKWFPERGQNRIGSMVETRGDWCISRQRVWGVPLALFVHKKTGEPLKDEKVLNRIVEIFEKDGSERWFDRPAQDFLGAEYKAEDFEQVLDIVDVWIESGMTQTYVLEQRPELRWPADLYLEGSDQHRGWFMSSLMVGCGTGRGAPYKNVLTHGFILDEKGYKMSKSVGNVTAPTALMEKYGADILRLWVAGSDYTEDIKFGENILQGHVDIYRRIRNTFCYLLGSLDGKDARVDYKELSDLDKFILHRLHEIDGVVRDCISRFDFQKMITVVHNFCARELSALYFDICKDTLYCEAIDSQKRRAVVTVLDHVFHHLTHWLAPFIPYTAEEAWLSYKGLTLEDMKESIHLSSMPKAPAEWKKDEIAARFEKVIAARGVVTGALEKKRADKMIGASLEASPKVYTADKTLAETLKAISFADVCITSSIAIENATAPAEAFTLADVAGVGVVVERAAGQKCDRCWKYTLDVGADAAYPAVCARCAGVVKKELKSEAA